MLSPFVPGIAGAIVQFVAPALIFNIEHSAIFAPIAAVQLFDPVGDLAPRHDQIGMRAD